MPSSRSRSRSTRRTATVTISAPLARIASSISRLLRYLPVPTISRDANDDRRSQGGPPPALSFPSHPPPTKWTISIRSPSFTDTSSSASRAKIFRLRSTTTVPERNASCRRSDATVSPGVHERGSPFRTMETPRSAGRRGIGSCRRLPRVRCWRTWFPRLPWGTSSFKGRRGRRGNGPRLPPDRGRPTLRWPRDAVGAGRRRRRHALRRDPPDRHDGHGGAICGGSHGIEPQGWAAWVRRGGVHGAQKEVVHRSSGELRDLAGRVDRPTDEAAAELRAVAGPPGLPETPGVGPAASSPLAGGRRLLPPPAPRPSGRSRAHVRRGGRLRAPTAPRLRAAVGQESAARAKVDGQRGPAGLQRGEQPRLEVAGDDLVVARDDMQSGQGRPAAPLSVAGPGAGAVSAAPAPGWLLPRVPDPTAAHPLQPPDHPELGGPTHRCRHVSAPVGHDAADPPGGSVGDDCRLVDRRAVDLNEPFGSAQHDPLERLVPLGADTVPRT